MTSFLQKWCSRREKIPFTMPLITYVGFSMNLIFANGAFRMSELRVLHRVHDPPRMSKCRRRDASKGQRDGPCKKSRMLLSHARIETYRWYLFRSIRPLYTYCGSVVPHMARRFANDRLFALLITRVNR